jgi:hypothetical protein
MMIVKLFNFLEDSIISIMNIMRKNNNFISYN